jgi:hypothetical protein
MKTMANSEAIAVKLQKICIAQRQCRQKISIQAMTIAVLPDHHVERLEGLLLAEPRDQFDQDSRLVLTGARVRGSGRMLGEC